MLFPQLTFPESLSVEIRRELEQFVSLLQGYLSQIGRWKDVEYLASNFRGKGSMAWTVGRDDHITFQYMVIGKTMWLSLYLDTTTVGGTLNNALNVLIPGGYVPAKKVQTPVTLYDNNTYADAFARVTAGSNLLEIARADVANFTASTDLTYVRCMMAFEIQ